MKAMVVFYSLEGNTKLIADIIAKEINSDVLELKPKKEFPRGGFKKYVWGGKSVVFGEKPELTNVIPSLEGYDTIIIGTPIWAGSYSPPINTFITKYKVEGKRVAFFACNAGGGTQKCFEKLKEVFRNNILIGNIDFVNPLKQDQEKIRQQVTSWIKQIGIEV